MGKEVKLPLTFSHIFHKEHTDYFATKYFQNENRISLNQQEYFLCIPDERDFGRDLKFANGLCNQSNLPPQKQTGRKVNALDANNPLDLEQTE